MTQVDQVPEETPVQDSVTVVTFPTVAECEGHQGGFQRRRTFVVGSVGPPHVFWVLCPRFMQHVRACLCSTDGRLCSL